MKENNLNNRVGKIIENVIYFLILIPLIIIVVRIMYQTIFYKDRIPDIFGYKLFVILDDNMDSSLDYGDLAIIHNENIDNIKINDSIAYRNGVNIITIHKVEEIQENNDEKTIVVNTLNNEINADQIITEKEIEGITVNKIPKLGLIMYEIAKPKTIIIVSCMILAIGEICNIFARELDKKDNMKKKETVKVYAKKK